MEQWYLFLNNVATGPYTPDQIRQMLRDGKITGKTMSRKGGNGKWIPMDQQNEMKAPEATISLGNNSRPPKLPEAECVYNEARGQLKLSCPKCHQHYAIDTQFKTGTALKCQICGLSFTARNPFQDPMREEEPLLRKADTKVDFSGDAVEGDLTCPHCWKTFSAENVLFISRHSDLLGDEIAGEFEQKRFMPTVYHSNGLPLDEMGVPCTDMACPHCHLRIPASILDLKSKYISIVGAPSSGKSYYLTTLVHLLREDLPKYCDCSFFDVDPTLNAVLDGYENSLFLPVSREELVILAKTEQTGVNFSDAVLMNGLSINLPKPFIFQMQPQTQDKPDAARNIVFYDNAGEHFQPGADTLLNPATLHLALSDAIFFIFDPLNDAGLRQICAQEDPQLEITSKVSNQTTLFSEMVSRIRRHGNMSASDRSKIPLIFLVGKYDAWNLRFPKDLEKMNPMSVDSVDLSIGINMDMIYDVSFALREFMLKYAPGIVAQAETFFEDVLFLPVSSFGTNAEKAKEHSDTNGNIPIGIVPSKLNPLWVCPPFFVLLRKWGFLPEKRAASQGGEHLQASIVKNHIVFLHPKTGARVSIPESYSGRRLLIDGKEYLLPEVKKASGKTEWKW